MLGNLTRTGFCNRSVSVPEERFSELDSSGIFGVKMISCVKSSSSSFIFLICACVFFFVKEMSRVIGRWTNHYGIIRELLFANSDLLMESLLLSMILFTNVIIIYYVLCNRCEIFLNFLCKFVRILKEKRLTIMENERIFVIVNDCIVHANFLVHIYICIWIINPPFLFLN